MRILLLSVMVLFSSTTWAYGDCSQAARLRIHSCQDFLEAVVAFNNSLSINGQAALADSAKGNPNHDASLPLGGALMSELGADSSQNLDKASKYCEKLRGECIDECTKSARLAEHFAPPDPDAAERAHDNGQRCYREISSIIKSAAPVIKAEKEQGTAGNAFREAVSNN